MKREPEFHPAHLDGPSLVLWEAANLIEFDGWVQHDLKNSGGYCLAGAIAEVSGSMGMNLEAYQRVRHTLLVPVPDWNDEPGRTKDEVVMKLRHVAISTSKGKP